MNTKSSFRILGKVGTGRKVLIAYYYRPYRTKIIPENSKLFPVCIQHIIYIISDVIPGIICVDRLRMFSSVPENCWHITSLQISAICHLWYIYIQLIHINIYLIDSAMYFYLAKIPTLYRHCIGWDPWSKKRVNYLSCIEEKRGGKDNLCLVYRIPRYLLIYYRTSFPITNTAVPLIFQYSR